MKDLFTDFFPRFGNLLFDHRKVVLTVIFAITAWFAWHIPLVRMVSDFADLLPQEHPYIKLHNSIRDTFGGANIIVMSMEVDEGTIFTNDHLQRLFRITQRLDEVANINHNLVTSLVHRNTRKIWMTPEGTIKSSGYYDPHRGDYSDEELEKMRHDVAANPAVYGALVSPDFKAALIKGTLNEGELDYGKVFEQVQKIRADESAPGVTIHATGHPMLVGWVDSYGYQIVQIFFYTVIIVLAILIVYTRRFYGVVLPLIGLAITSAWGLGFMGVFGYDLDPLMLVVPFLISSRSLSHGIQKVERYFLELARTGDKLLSARNTFNALFRPGALAIVADAAALFLIGLGSVPLNDKMAIYASFWAVTMVVTVLVTLPMLMAELPQPKDVTIKRTFVRRLFPRLAGVVASRGRCTVVLLIALGIVVAGGYFASWVQIGEPEPGSPLLYPDHDYNVSARAINERFPGVEEMYVIARTDDKGGIKRPEVQRAITDFREYMMLDDSVGATRSIDDLLMQINQMTRNDDPRWAVIPTRAADVGGLMFMYMMSSPIPSALLQYVDADERMANVVLFYEDHTGETIRRAIHMAKEWIDEVGSKVKGFHLDLAGGPVGVTAAINEEIYETNLMVVPAVLVLIFAFTVWFYGSLHAGLMMMVSMGFATSLAYGCMGLLGMGLNVNTVPMIAVGIGLGVDYGIYMMDRIKEEMHVTADLQEAVKRAVSTTGVAIAFTATTLIGGIIMWVFISDMRFQADSAKLLMIMLLLNAAAATFVVPAWADLFRPRFILRAAEERWAEDALPDAVLPEGDEA